VTHKIIGDASDVTHSGLWNVALVATKVLEERALSIFFYREDVGSRFLRDIYTYIL
jgi:hypothetical protein